MATPHINANKGDIAKVVLFPGDPLRAEYIANNYLENVRKVNEVRNMFAFTGTYKGKEITVMGSGMGMPSAGIYSYELYSQYDVEVIIRIGTTGSFNKDVKVRDLVIAHGASTNSNWAHQYDLPGPYAALPTYEIVEKSVEIAKRENVSFHVGNILSSDIFYDAEPDAWKKWAHMGVLAVEMESYALFSNAAFLGKKAACLLTVSDSLVTHEVTSAEERQNSFNDMMKVALETAYELY